MDAIKQYLDYMFRTLPPTPQTMQARADLLAMMEDKYTELRNSGMPEHQAVAQVISDFGDLEELAQELNLPTNSIHEGEAQTPVMQVDAATAREFMEHRRTRSFQIGAGTFLAIAAGAAISVFAMLSDPDSGVFSEPVGIGVGLGVGLALIGAALFFFLNHPYGDEYDKFSKTPLALSYDAKAAVQEEIELRSRGLRVRTISGIGMILIAAFLIVFGAAGEDSLWGELGFTLMFAAALTTIAVGVWTIVSAQTVNNSFKILLEKADFSREKKQRDPIFEAFSAVYWLSIVLVYFGQGVWTNWDYAHITWEIWPTAGILFAIIAVIWSTIRDARKSENQPESQF